jgi:hypothetical protein
LLEQVFIRNGCRILYCSVGLHAGRG